MYIQSLFVENVKAFDELHLDLARPGASGESKYAGLNFFVGGNSSGKSTLLKCLAMTISGPIIAAQQLVNTAGWLRRSAKRGSIELRVQRDDIFDQFRTGGAPPATDGFSVGLVLEADALGAVAIIKARDYRTPAGTRVKTAERGPWNADATGWFLGAYGPLRRLTGSSTDALRYALARGNLASCVTLFREDAALSESETWLKHEYSRSLQQKDRNQPQSPLIEEVRAFLNDDLLPPGFQITRITVDDVFMSTPNGGELPLRDLSDGCRSVYALILDIIHGMASAYGTASLFGRDASGRVVVQRPGVILIDELEAHLHPAWQQTVCEWLKTRFPKIQFFITTHSPLLVQAADEGGVFVLPLPEELVAGHRVRRLTPREQKQITLGRAEKVLLGEAFGLKHTWGQRAEELRKTWERLSALKEARGELSLAEQRQLDRLQPELELVFDEPMPEVCGA